MKFSLVYLQDQIKVPVYYKNKSFATRADVRQVGLVIGPWDNGVHAVKGEAETSFFALPPKPFF